MPSRARQEAAYEPAGPPPTTSTEVWVGIDIFFSEKQVLFGTRNLQLLVLRKLYDNR